MPTRGFHSEWSTIKNHRILLECRASFPDERMKFIARVAVELCDSHTDGEARVVHVYYDDKSCQWSTTIASPDPAHKNLDKALSSALSTIFGFGNCDADVVIVQPGDRESDHYHHMEHLSVGSEIAVDRFRHRDKDYVETIHCPS